eukprot:TRINITY_DN4029_c0_g2_i1.p1 TRINITY_DN4029_c0_g2~~TRINITY_DN4029_c0_g2_i1.p1  ORF type:complete len:517 (+),score=42.88 TRINITY_DN4029_c0_g2_i1:626-2176(+)
MKPFHSNPENRSDQYRSLDYHHQVNHQYHQYKEDTYNHIGLDLEGRQCPTVASYEWDSTVSTAPLLFPGGQREAQGRKSNAFTGSIVPNSAETFQCSMNPSGLLLSGFNVNMVSSTGTHSHNPLSLCADAGFPQGYAYGTESDTDGNILGLVERGHESLCPKNEGFAARTQTISRIGLGLDLGGRTYFSSDDNPLSRLYKRSRAVPAVSQVPKCQAEGCRADLSTAKHYHRRHKVCEMHSKASTVISGGLTQRFCQQCSRFHVLSEFDEGKRSCRKRLADHNRRRRKPQPNEAATDTSSAEKGNAEQEHDTNSAGNPPSSHNEHKQIDQSEASVQKGYSSGMSLSPPVIQSDKSFQTANLSTVAGFGTCNAYNAFETDIPWLRTASSSTELSACEKSNSSNSSNAQAPDSAGIPSNLRMFTSIQSRFRPQSSSELISANGKCQGPSSHDRSVSLSLKGTQEHDNMFAVFHENGNSTIDDSGKEFITNTSSEQAEQLKSKHILQTLQPLRSLYRNGL